MSWPKIVLIAYFAINALFTVATSDDGVAGASTVVFSAAFIALVVIA